jgi:hypothetical protein
MTLYERFSWFQLVLLEKLVASATVRMPNVRSTHLCMFAASGHIFTAS